MANISIDHIQMLDRILVALAQSLDITKTQYDNLVRSYGAVGEYLDGDPLLTNYHPVISPQGSLRLGTIIQPVCDDDDLDVDLVIRITEKPHIWAQYDLKNHIGTRLKAHGIYSNMLDEEGRRCWTILYRQDTDDAKERYHMDILPSVADREYSERIKRMENSSFSTSNIDDIAIRITDTKSVDYRTSTNIMTWLKSNPDGYAMWFASRCQANKGFQNRAIASIVPVDKYVQEKTILQRIVQILKRHRDIIFNGDEDKPISIIITTLSAKAYQGENSLFEGLNNVIDRMEMFITRNYDGSYSIENPVNPKENFADKWKSHPQRRDNFFKWLRKLKEDRAAILSNKGIELRETFSKVFGKDMAIKAFSDMTKTHKKDAINGKLKIASTGIIGSIGQQLNAANTFFGDN